MRPCPDKVIPASADPGLDITGVARRMGSRRAAVSRRGNGVAHTIKKGSDLVMQIHYHLDGKAEQDQSSLGSDVFERRRPLRG